MHFKAFKTRTEHIEAGKNMAQREEKIDRERVMHVIEKRLSIRVRLILRELLITFLIISFSSMCRVNVEQEIQGYHFIAEIRS